MKIENEHIEPMTFKRLMSQMIYQGKGVFLSSLLGNFLILGVLVTVLFLLFDYVALLGNDEEMMALLRTFNNALILSLGGVHIFYLLLCDRDMSTKQQMKTAMRKTLKVTPVLFIATFLFSILATMGMAWLLIPGILIYTFFGLYSQTVAFENQGILSSLLRSREIVRGSFWKVMGLLIGTLLVSNIITVGIEASLRFNMPVYPMWLDIGLYVFLYMLILPFLGSLYTFLYLDLRSRKEAFDHNVFLNERRKIFT